MKLEELHVGQIKQDEEGSSYNNILVSLELNAESFANMPERWDSLHKNLRQPFRHYGRALETFRVSPSWTYLTHR